MKGLVQSGAWLFALIGAALAFAVLDGRLPSELARRSLRRSLQQQHAHAHQGDHAHEQGADACCEAEPDAPQVASGAPSAASAAAVIGAAASAAAASSPTGTPAARSFVVCEREEARVTSTTLRLRRDEPPLLAIGCGSSVHVLGFDRIGGAIEPRRVLELRLDAHAPAEAPHTIEAHAADVDGDGHVDLVASVQLVDANGSPRGGGVFLSKQRPEGGLEPARRLLELAAAASAPASFDGVRGEDLVLLDAADARLGRPSALWLIAGGPSPLRTAVLEAGVGSRAVAACDLDGDGRDEIIEGGGQDGALHLWRSGVPRGEPPLALPLPGARELVCVVDEARSGAQARVLAAVGEQLALLHMRPGAPPELRAIPESTGLRSVRTIDVDGDGSAEIVGYVHPRVLAFVRQDEIYAPRPLAKLVGDGEVLDAGLVALGDGGIAIAVVTQGSHSIEISVHGVPTAGGTVELPRRSATPLRSSPLVQRIVLR